MERCAETLAELSLLKLGLQHDRARYMYGDIEWQGLARIMMNRVTLLERSEKELESSKRNLKYIRLCDRTSGRGG